MSQLFKDRYGRNRIYEFWYRHWVFGYYLRHNKTYKGLPRWREIVVNIHQRNDGTKLFTRWVIR